MVFENRLKMMPPPVGGRGRGRGGRGELRRQETLKRKQSSQNSLSAAAENNHCGLDGEMRKMEEKLAANKIQRMVRTSLTRLKIREMLQRVFQKVYDPVKEAYYYYDTRSGESTWTKPAILKTVNCDISETKPVLLEDPAAVRIQQMFRARKTRMLVKEIVRDIYQKHFDPTTKMYYYLNTRSSERFYAKPKFLGSDDLEVELFNYRTSICRLPTPSNMYGNAIFVSFRGIKCIVTDIATLPNEEMCRFVRAQFNYKERSVPFFVGLQPEKFFLTSDMEIPEYCQQALNYSSGNQKDLKNSLAHLNFTICAIDESDLSAGKDSVYAIDFAINDDKKLSCTSDYRKNEEIEIVGHPHGKQQTVHKTHIQSLLPSSINPETCVYQKLMESGSSSSGVFNRMGRLIGIHRQLSMKDNPNSCTLISHIIAFTRIMTVPPIPLVLSSCISHNSIKFNWTLTPTYKPLNGLVCSFVVEFAKVEQDKVPIFRRIYDGTSTTFAVNNLEPLNNYCLRCRTYNQIFSSGYSYPLRVQTLPVPSNSWRVKYCKNCPDVIAVVNDFGHEFDVLLRSMRWIVDACSKKDQLQLIATDLMNCGGIQTILQLLEQHRKEPDLVVLIAYILQALSSLEGNIRSIVGTEKTHGILISFLKCYEKHPKILHWTISAIAYLCKDNASSKQLFLVLGGIIVLIDVLEVHSRNKVLIREGNYALAVLADNYEPCKYQISINKGIKLLKEVLSLYPHDAGVLYWCLVALGNLACDYPSNRLRGEKYDLVDSICVCKSKFLIQLNDLHIKIEKQSQYVLEMKSTAIGEEIQNEIDLEEHKLNDLQEALKLMTCENVIPAADYALHYLMCKNKRKQHEVAKKVIRKALFERLYTAFDIWLNNSLKIHQVNIMNRFFIRLEHRNVITAFQKWDEVTQELRKPKSILDKYGSGIALNLSKKKKEKYRVMVLQK